MVRCNKVREIMGNKQQVIKFVETLYRGSWCENEIKKMRDKGKWFSWKKKWKSIGINHCDKCVTISYEKKNMEHDSFHFGRIWKSSYLR